MKIPTCLTSILLAVLIFALPWVFDADAQEHQCVFKPTMDDVYLAVRDVDQAGNTRAGLIWRGWIFRGRTQTIQSAYGTVRYSFKSRSDYRDSGSNQSTCSNDNVITVP